MILNEDTILGSLLDADPSCQTVFSAFDMACSDCPSARGETIQEACAIHGADTDALLKALQTHFQDSQG